MKTSKSAPLLASLLLLLFACQSEPTVEPQPTVQQMQPEPTATPQQMVAEPTDEAVQASEPELESENIDEPEQDHSVAIAPAELIGSIQPDVARLYNPFSPIQIEFNVAVDQQSVEEQFEVQPTVVGEIEWRNNTFLFWPTEPFENGTTYEFGFNSGVRVLDSDQVLDTPQFWTFETESIEGKLDFEEYQQLGSFGRNRLFEGNVNLETIYATGSRKFEFRFLKNRPTEITFNLYPATIDDYFKTERVRPDSTAPIYSWQHTTTLQLDAPRNIEQAEVPSDVSAGLYLLEMDTGQSIDLILLLVTDYAMLAKGSKNEITTWLLNSTGEPATNALITLWGNNGDIMSQQEADAEGFSSHRFSADEAAPHLITADVNGQLALVGLEKRWDENRRSVDGYLACQPINRWGVWGYEQKDHEVVIQSDRNIYGPNGTIYLKAFIRVFDDGLIAPVPPLTPVTLSVGREDEQLYSEELLVSDFGTVSTSIELDGGINSDWIPIKVSVNGETFEEHIFIAASDYIGSTAQEDEVTQSSTSAENQDEPDPNDAFLSIQTNKDRYISREPALVTINSSFSGPAVLTIERGTVRRFQNITLTAPTTQVEVPVVERDAPNVFISVSAFEPIDMTTVRFENQTRWSLSLSDQILRTASTEIFSSVLDKQLTVEIIPSKESYAPGENGQFQVKVTNQQGVPVSAEVSLILQAESILPANPPISSQTLDHFYSPRPHNTNTFYSLNPERSIGTFGGGGCGGGSGLVPRAPDFGLHPDTAWIPSQTTDFAGETQSTFTLPDSPSQWRVIATAITADTQIGETSIVIETR